METSDNRDSDAKIKSTIIQTEHKLKDETFDWSLLGGNQFCNYQEKRFEYRGESILIKKTFVKSKQSAFWCKARSEYFCEKFHILGCKFTGSDLAGRLQPFIQL